MVFKLPHPGSPLAAGAAAQAAALYVAAAEKSARLGRLGDLSGIEHLEPHMHMFLEDHPDIERNVFVMMPFDPSPQHTAIFAAIESALAARNMTGLRADVRDYTGDLWSNVEVYLTGCRYGIAVFEHINTPYFNPNVSLELGYMLSRGKRCLILKEQRLLTVPSDIAHKLYKPFDAYDIANSVSAAVGRWIDVDLRLGPT